MIAPLKHYFYGNLAVLITLHDRALCCNCFADNFLMTRDELSVLAIALEPKPTESFRDLKGVMAIT